jgi:tRNA-Thr(GGU) m(6)t(6)A37 methyltransferase TsaA
MEIKFRPIGVVHSPFKTKEDIQPEKYAYPKGFDHIQGELEIFEEFKDGLKDVEGFSHLIVLFTFHRSEGYKLQTKPLLDNTLRGIFAIRSPNRPNPIGLTIVKNLGVKGNRVSAAGIDMLEGTPILDIKPYTPRDQKENIQLGWLKDKIKRS